MSATEQRVATEVWRKDPDRPGYLKLLCRRSVQEVYDDLRTIVGEYPHGGEEYFSVVRNADGLLLRDWPHRPGSRLAVFAVNGSSEGDYVHVEVHDGSGGRELVLLAKTFEGRDAAWQFARCLADLLEER